MCKNTHNLFAVYVDAVCHRGVILLIYLIYTHQGSKWGGANESCDTEQSRFLKSVSLHKFWKWATFFAVPEILPFFRGPDEICEKFPKISYLDLFLYAELLKSFICTPLWIGGIYNQLCINETSYPFFTFKFIKISLIKWFQFFWYKMFLEGQHFSRGSF